MRVVSFFDFILERPFRTFFPPASAGKTHYERRPNRVRPAHGRTPQIRIRQMCSSLSRQSSDSLFAHLRAVLGFGFRSADLPRKLAGYRNLPPRIGFQTLSQWHWPTHCAKHSGRCERKTRLADLRRLRSGSHSTSRHPLCRRTLRRRPQGSRLCFGLDHHRSVLVVVSLGEVSPTQSRGQTPHSAGTAWQLPHRSNPEHRQGSRRQYSRPALLRAWRLLYRRPWLSGFSQALPFASKRSFFCDPRQEQLPLPSTLFPSGGQSHRLAPGSNRRSEQFLSPSRLSGGSPTHWLLRSGDRTKIGHPDQQLYRTGFDHRSTLPLPLAGRTVFQMDQAAFANQSFLRYFRKRSTGSSLDCGLSIRSGFHPQETTATLSQPVHDSTDFEFITFRENAHFTAAFSTTPADSFA